MNEHEDKVIHGRRAVLAAGALMLGASAGIVYLSSSRLPPLLRVGTHLWPGYAPLYQARASGALDGTGVRVVELPTSSESIRGLRSGVLEGATLTLDETLRAQASGCDLRIVTVIDRSIGGDGIVARRGIGSLGDLRGKRVGAEREGVGSLFLARALRTVGLTIGDILLHDLEAHEHEEALLSGRLDAVVTFEPRIDHLRRQGARLLCDSGTLPGEVLDVLVVKAEQMRGDLPGAQALFSAWLAASRELRSGAAVPSAAREMGMDAAELAECLRRISIPDEAENRALVAGSPPGLARSLEAQASELGELGLLDAPVEPGRLLLTAAEAHSLPW